jgi:RimJ/RimL family protein N-acetyltransferase
VEANENDYLFFTLWTVILKSENRMVGDLCFRGTPGENGSIEIGYGTYEDFRGNGFMTEAVGGMINWAKMQPLVKSIVASTDKTNVASMVILQKNGFVKSGESDDFFHWKLQL